MHVLVAHLFKNPFPDRLHPDHRFAHADEIFLPGRQDCALIQPEAGHGLKEAVSLPLPVIFVQLMAHLDRPGNFPPSFRNKIAFPGSGKVIDLASPAAELDEDDIFEETPLVR